MRWVLPIVFVACWASPPPVAPVTPPPPVAPATPEPPATRVELVEGTPTTLDDGTVINVKTVMYAHMNDSRNLSSCTLVLARGAAATELSLTRLHGGATPDAPAGDALGWRFTLDMADPYQQPSRAVVEARRLP